MGWLLNKYFALSQVAMRLSEAARALPEALGSRNPLISYWGFNNFGDLITPLLLRDLGYTPIHAPRVSYAQFAFVGSILDTIGPAFKGVILGSGFLNDRRPKRLPKAKILGVRGVLSQQLLGIKDKVQLGDGGLILAKYIIKRPNKQFSLGIVPHYSDAADIRILAWKENFGNEVRFINVMQSPEKVFQEIAMCECVASSSLHGLVLADSLSIPSLWLGLSDLQGNGTFKFEDYYSAFDVKRTPFCPTGEEKVSDLIKRASQPPANVEEISSGVYEQFNRLPTLF